MLSFEREIFFKLHKINYKSIKKILSNSIQKASKGSKTKKEHKNLSTTQSIQEIQESNIVNSCHFKRPHERRFKKISFTIKNKQRETISNTFYSLLTIKLHATLTPTLQLYKGALKQRDHQ